MALRINDTAPDFKAETSQGLIQFHQWIGDSWAILFSHPKDFTPVRTTELGYMAGMKAEFDKRNCKVIGLSIDAAGDHGKWALDNMKAEGSGGFVLRGLFLGWHTPECRTSVGEILRKRPPRYLANNLNGIRSTSRFINQFGRIQVIS